MRLPILNAVPQTRELTDSFYGYRHRLKLKRGELFDTRNLSTRDFPLLSTRKRRGMVCRLREPQGLLAKDKLCWVDGGTLYYEDHGDQWWFTELVAKEKWKDGQG